MKKILVTGASGFIGSHVIDVALERGLTPICFDRYVHEYPEGCETFQGDIRDEEAVKEAVDKVDYAISLAGILGTQETIKKPIPSVQTNIIGALNFYEACVPTQFHEVRGVQIGVGNYWMNNSYSISKSTAIRYAKMYNKERGTKIAMVRGLNAYGPRQKHKPVRKIMPTFVVRALRGEDIEIYGSGEQIMDMIYVRDLANILLDACMKDHGVYDKTIHGGTGRRTTVNQIAEEVIKAAGSTSKLIHSEMRPGETKDSVVLADTKTLEPLGIDPKDFVSLEEGVAETVKWYRDNYNWQED